MTEFQNCFVIEWEIEKFSVFSQLEELRSPTFKEEPSQQQEWYMILRQRLDEGFISLELCNNVSVSGTFTFTVSVIDRIRCSHFSKVISVTCDGLSSLFKIEKFIKTSELLEKGPSLMPTDTFTLQCIIRKPFKLHSAKQSLQFQEFSGTWIITNFSEIEANNCNLSYPLALNFVNAPSFSMKLRVAEKSGDESKVFLQFKKTNKRTEIGSFISCSIIVSYEINVVQNNESEFTLFDGKHVFSSNEDVFSTPNANIFEVNGRQNVLTNDTLRLNVSVLVSDPSKLDFSFAESEYFLPGIGTMVGEYCHNLCENIYKEKKFCDVVLKIGTLSLSAHKSVLSSKSPVFRAMFDSDLNENGVVEIADIDADTMESFLQLLYTGKIDETLKFEDILKLYAVSRKHRVPSFALLRSNILSKMTVENVWKIWFSALKYEDAVLKVAVSLFLSDNAEGCLNMLGRFEDIMALPSFACESATNSEK